MASPPMLASDAGWVISSLQLVKFQGTPLGRIPCFRAKETWARLQQLRQECLDRSEALTVSLYLLFSPLYFCIYPASSGVIVLIQGRPSREKSLIRPRHMKSTDESKVQAKFNMAATDGYKNSSPTSFQFFFPFLFHSFFSFILNLDSSPQCLSA